MTQVLVGGAVNDTTHIESLWPTPTQQSNNPSPETQARGSHPAFPSPVVRNQMRAMARFKGKLTFRTSKIRPPSSETKCDPWPASNENWLPLLPRRTSHPQDVLRPKGVAYVQLLRSRRPL